jgi:chromosome segregation ATPase
MSTALADDTTTTAATEMTTDNTSITSDKSPTTLTHLEDEVAQLKSENNKLVLKLTRANAVIALHKADYNKLETKFHILATQVDSLLRSLTTNTQQRQHDVDSLLRSLKTKAQQQQYDDDSPGTVTHDEDPPRA